MSLNKLISTLPKAELHLHIEGSLEPDLLMELSEKHQIALPYSTIEQIQAAYNFQDLQSFLDLYYLGASVLIDEEDFYQLMWRYLLKCKEDNVVHTEIMFDPQTHTERGIDFSVFMSGFMRALKKAENEWGLTHKLIMSFLRHLSEESAFETLEAAKPYLDNIQAVGLDSSELGNPPEKFERVFKRAQEIGLKLVAHAGEEGPPSYIWSALNSLKVDRIDHGVRCVEDKVLVDYLITNKVPLTVCPLSNIKLCVFDQMQQHNILDMLDQGLVVTVNADDPSYFGGYLNDNFVALNSALNMRKEQLITLVKNSFVASFLPEEIKQHWCTEIDKIDSIY